MIFQVPWQEWGSAKRRKPDSVSGGAGAKYVVCCFVIFKTKTAVLVLTWGESDDNGQKEGLLDNSRYSVFIWQSLEECQVIEHFSDPSFARVCRLIAFHSGEARNPEEKQIDESSY
ncbi:hypothetical protein JTB14_025983 [Gonioctena quinquepunctata]|nr:hypothetical protein JTB14_025983 [Gonioctena quinquepunctata]